MYVDPGSERREQWIFYTSKVERLQLPAISGRGRNLKGSKSCRRMG